MRSFSSYSLGEWLDLDHYHYDIFELDMTEDYGEKRKVSFSLNNEGAISQLHITVEPEIGNTIFKALAD